MSEFQGLSVHTSGLINKWFPSVFNVHPHFIHLPNPVSGEELPDTGLGVRETDDVGPF